MKGKPGVVEFLIENGADVNATDDVGSNALHRAAEHNNVKVAEMLIKHGINMDYKDVYGEFIIYRTFDFSVDFMRK